eukprot:546663-Prymnesium_polylepis.1
MSQLPHCSSSLRVSAVVRKDLLEEVLAPARVVLDGDARRLFSRVSSLVETPYTIPPDRVCPRA